jgi:hypothetical protein
MASYTGDNHGRWDNCRVRIFKMMSDKTLRILTLMEGLEESVDQRVGKDNLPGGNMQCANRDCSLCKGSGTGPSLWLQPEPPNHIHSEDASTRPFPQWQSPKDCGEANAP